MNRTEEPISAIQMQLFTAQSRLAIAGGKELLEDYLSGHLRQLKDGDFGEDTDAFTALLKRPILSQSVYSGLELALKSGYIASNMPVLGMMQLENEITGKNQFLAHYYR